MAAQLHASLLVLSKTTKISNQSNWYLQQGGKFGDLPTLPPQLGETVTSFYTAASIVSRCSDCFLFFNIAAGPCLVPQSKNLRRKFCSHFAFKIQFMELQYGFSCNNSQHEPRCYTLGLILPLLAADQTYDRLTPPELAKPMTDRERQKHIMHYPAQFWSWFADLASDPPFSKIIKQRMEHGLWP